MHTQNKKGNIGIGSLVILISLLMVVAIAATVLIQTGTSLQQDTMKTSEQGKTQITNSLTPIDLLLNKNADDEYTILTETIKLTSASDTIKFEDLVVLINLNDDTTTLEYKGTSAPIENSPDGFFTRGTEDIGRITAKDLETIEVNIDSYNYTFQNFDIDYDGINDKLKFCPPPGGFGDLCPQNSDGRHLAIHLSSENRYIYIPLINSTGDLISEICTGSEQTEIYMDKEAIDDYGYITLKALVSPTACRIRSSETDDFKFEMEKTQIFNDIDLDMVMTDYFKINNTHAILNLSSEDLISIPLGDDLSSPPATLNVNEKIANSQGNIIGTLEISGTTSLESILDESIDINIIPAQKSGYYVVNYLQTGQHHRPGNIIESDLAQIHMELPREVGEEETISVKIIPIYGAPLVLNVETDVGMTKNVIQLFP
jgi:archaellin